MYNAFDLYHYMFTHSSFAARDFARSSTTTTSSRTGGGWRFMQDRTM